MLAKSLLGLLALAAPAVRAANYGAESADVTVLQFAATLEALEATYYAEGLKKFGVADLVKAGLGELLASGVANQLGVFADQEASHLAYLNAAIEGAGFDLFWKTCEIDFSSVLTDLPTFVAAARAFENVGVGAYIGASPLLSPSTLIAAETIATIEARHSSFINILAGGSYTPNPYDIGLTPQSVGALISPYLVKGEGKCAFKKEFGIAFNRPLTASISHKKLDFAIRGVPQLDGFCQLIQGGMSEALVMGTGECIIPDTFSDGPVYVWITGNDTPLKADPVVQIKTAVVAGPSIFFVDPETPTGFSIM